MMMRSVEQIIEASRRLLGLEVEWEFGIGFVLQFCDRDSDLSSDVDSTESNAILG